MIRVEINRAWGTVSIDDVDANGNGKILVSRAFLGGGNCRCSDKEVDDLIERVKTAFAPDAKVEVV